MEKTPPEASDHARDGRGGEHRRPRPRIETLADLVFGLSLGIDSIAPPLWAYRFEGVPLRLYVWTLPLISYWAGRALRPESRTYRVR